MRPSSSTPRRSACGMMRFPYRQRPCRTTPQYSTSSIASVRLRGCGPAGRPGTRATDGLPMLVEQGAAAFERWFGMPAPRDAMWRAIAAERPRDRDDADHRHGSLGVCCPGIGLLSLLVPPACAVCRCALRRPRDDIVCGACLARVVPLANPRCARCWSPSAVPGCAAPAGAASTGAPDHVAAVPLVCTPAPVRARRTVRLPHG